MIELDPKFVQVIIKRFYDVTGWAREIKCLSRNNFDFSFLNK
jgi:hypothetical protein